MSLEDRHWHDFEDRSCQEYLPRGLGKAPKPYLLYSLNVDIQNDWVGILTPAITHKHTDACNHTQTCWEEASKFQKSGRLRGCVHSWP